ncbi:alpha/beta hydrolase fold protein [Candidatus Nitrosoglobus terrae]|uniref:Alpha/beta hydrolase fold protein n=1 Tax=Candidatus Nitrosoglobus terrae TaxID=1630141 RepID=A0A1Q2SN42_9GAMM|nr:alpha/beta fold hydrolase [Candidatus Nitrosoglobus terrae]BAW80531.1 alpha/beta hydrolase fold protein [Candidatus Nitrosoglobus terrae]
MQLHHQVQGKGTPLIILHGLFGSISNWRSLATAFSRQFQVITIDLPNHGHSPPKAIFNYPSLAQDLIDFMDEQSIDTAALLGHSLGGKIAMQCALDFPNRITHLLVADIAPRAYAPEHLLIFNALSELNLTAYKNRLEIDEALSRQIPNLETRQFLLMNLEKNKGGYSWRINLNNLQQNYQAICAAVVGKNVYLGPSLFIKGEDSGYIRGGDKIGIRKWFPKAEMVSIPKSGHWLHAEAPEVFATIVLTFLGK